MTMSDDLLDDLFLACALEAFLQVARLRQDWPEHAETRELAGRLYEDALAAKNGRPRRHVTESRIGMPAEPATDPG